MNTKLNMNKLPLLAVGLGALTLTLRLSLFLLGRDEKGLLITGHPLDILIWIITAAAAALVITQVWKLGGSGKYEHNFGPDAAAFAGCVVLAAGIAATVLLDWNAWTRMALLCNVCGLLAAPALVAAGLCRRRGSRPFIAFHGMVCLYLTVYAVSHYQIWCSRPQMQNWFFSMAAVLLLALFSYYQTAFDADMGSRRMQLITGLLAAFFCTAAVAGGEDVLLYLGGAAWAITNLCRLTPVRRRRPNPITEKTEEDAE